ncbi:arrestin, beta 2b isoform X3 [Embiotoca jacksoni]|uniref:arrestin, beta 2b isoform X3 n=1 Tax=Embiotoca jacksoni TaxID=100190 RepID=UPI003703F931
MGDKAGTRVFKKSSPNRPGRPGPVLQEGSVCQHHPGLPPPAGGDEGCEPPAGEAAEEAGSACLHLQLHHPPEPALLSDPPAGSRGHWEGLRRGLRAESILRQECRGQDPPKVQFRQQRQNKQEHSETQRHRDTETQRLRDSDTETQRHRDTNRFFTEQKSTITWKHPKETKYFVLFCSVLFCLVLLFCIEFFVPILWRPQTRPLVNVQTCEAAVCRNSVHLLIRKVQFAPEKPGPQPIVETSRSFLMSDRSLHLESSLDKQLYYHGEAISINVHVTNNSTKTVKRVKISVRQYADICLFSTAHYKCAVAQLEADDQVSPSSTSCQVYTLTPMLGTNREKRGLALDGKLKHEDTNLASSTILKEGSNKEMMGILVSYRVKVKLVVSRGGSRASFCLDASQTC